MQLSTDRPYRIPSLGARDISQSHQIESVSSLPLHGLVDARPRCPTTVFVLLEISTPANLPLVSTQATRLYFLPAHLLVGYGGWVGWNMPVWRSTRSACMHYFISLAVQSGQSICTSMVFDGILEVGQLGCPPLLHCSKPACVQVY